MATGFSRLLDLSERGALRGWPSPQRGEMSIASMLFRNPLRSVRSETGDTFRSAGARNIQARLGSINVSLRWSEGDIDRREP